MAKIAVFGANPINALAVRIGLGRRLVGGGFADGIDLFNALAVFFALLLLLYMTTVVSGLMRQNQRLAQEVAALGWRLDRLGRADQAP